MKHFLEDITGVVINYNTPYLLERAINSIRDFYPDLNILVIDGSDVNNGSNGYPISITGTNYREDILLGYNIGHGKGIDYALKQIKTKYALVFDTDIVMIKRCIFEMKCLMHDDVFGVGLVHNIDKNGGADYRELRYGYEKLKEPFCKSLHSYFFMVNVEIYKQYKPYFHHGCPELQTMIDINEKKNHRLVNFDLWDYIIHHWEGTRQLRPEAYQKETWNKI
jgi:hypothetical protein